MDALSGTKPNSIDFLNYIFYVMDTKHYPNMGDFYYDYWKHEQSLSSLKQNILEFRQFFRDDIYAGQIPEFTKAEMLASDIITLLDELSVLYKQIKNPTGYFRSIRSKISVEKGTHKILKFKSKLLKIHILIGAIIEKYPNTYGNKAKIILEKYDYLKLSSVADYKIFADMERGAVFTSKTFRLLDRYAFIFFDAHSLHISNLYSLLKKLEYLPNYKIYFYNVIRFNRMFPDYSNDIKLKRGLNHYYSDVPSLADENIFFDTQFIDMCNLWLVIIEKKFLSRENIRDEIDFGKYMDSIFKIRKHLENNRKNGEEHLNNQYYLNLRKLASLNIKIEEKIFVLGNLEIMDNFNEDIVELLILFKIRKIYNIQETSIARNISELLTANNKIKQEKSIIAGIWGKTVDPSLNDISHLYIFLRLWAILSKSFFMDLINNKYVLSSSDLHNLEVETSIYYAKKLSTINSEIVARLRNDSQSNKTVLVIAPKSDWNLAHDDIYTELKKIPRDKFEVQFVRIGAVNQLIFVIKNIGIKKTIDILIIIAHGNPNLMRFSYSKNGVLNKEVLKSKMFDDMDKYFSSNAVCYIDSCSTGKGFDPIAKYIKKRFGIRTIAPSSDTGSEIISGEEGPKILYRKSKEKTFLP